MRLIDADELMEHVWRDKLDSRELIAQMVENAPTVKEITTKIPINLFERLVSQEPKTGHWMGHGGWLTGTASYFYCLECGCNIDAREFHKNHYNYCPTCGAKMIESIGNDEELDFVQPKKTVGKLINADVLNKIRAEISGMYRVILEGTPEGDCAAKWNDYLDEVLQVIDKYRAESE